MPPQRTIPPAKAVKTERTHEENQERAYIAASRRSDRSLEARVESARRASEIHKRRTGRSLRVTEQDVVNEEMYEEEDDDLPMQYRRLTAHLQTGSADFNRRLAAYLTNHVAMRSALDQAITNSYAQQYPNAPHFAHNQSMYTSPMMPQSIPMQSPQAYRQSPYPTPGAPGYRPQAHGRSASVVASHELAGFAQTSTNPSPAEATNQVDHRRMSMPPSVSSASAATPSRTPQSLQTPHSDPTASQSTLPFNLTQEPLQSVPQQQSVPLHHQAMQAPYSMGGLQDFGPFTTSLPMESQMLLGSALDPNDPLTSMFMAGSEAMVQPYYNFNPSASMSKQRNFHPSYDGMSATLAPSALDMSPDQLSYTNPSSTSSDSLPTPAFNFNYDGAFGDLKAANLTRSSSTQGSGGVTPAIDGGWDAFINGNSWEENAI
ncbi:MAG: hypothetical protein M1830_000796 [Pleopsidium flavum]|nr:MAG: hypothetical protein M1830_000796 [Pleopsidium flavum]